MRASVYVCAAKHLVGEHLVQFLFGQRKAISVCAVDDHYHGLSEASG